MFLAYHQQKVLITEQQVSDTNSLFELANITSTSQRTRILHKFTRRAKSILVIGNPDNQHLDKWSSTVLLFLYIH